MGRMKIVLTEDVENLGRVGEVVAVRGGYGRNFLIPQGRALPANKGNLAMVAERRQVYEAAAVKQRSEAETVAARLAKMELSVARKAGEGQTLYGSVTSVDIADLIAAKGVIVDKRRLLIPQPIKQLGEFPFSIRLHPEVLAELTLKVEADES